MYHLAYFLERVFILTESHMVFESIRVTGSNYFATYVKINRNITSFIFIFNSNLYIVSNTILIILHIIHSNIDTFKLIIYT